MFKYHKTHKICGVMHAILTPHKYHVDRPPLATAMLNTRKLVSKLLLRNCCPLTPHVLPKGPWGLHLEPLRC